MICFDGCVRNCFLSESACEIVRSRALKIDLCTFCTNRSQTVIFFVLYPVLMPEFFLFRVVFTFNYIFFETRFSAVSGQKRGASEHVPRLLIFALVGFSIKVRIKQGDKLPVLEQSCRINRLLDFITVFLLGGRAVFGRHEDPTLAVGKVEQPSEILGHDC